MREVLVIASTSLPLAPGADGPAVRDLTARLRAAGFDPTGELSHFGPETERALREFQASRGLDVGGVCDHDTWMALVEAGFSFGDRLLYLTSPMVRGDDVAELQLRLGALGFDAGRVDGIFGPMTQTALLEFQQNMGLVTDEVCGPDTVAALNRLHPRAGSSSVAGVRERHRLRSRASTLTLKVCIAHLGEADLLAGAIAADLRQAGASVGITAGDDWSAIAQAVNEFGAEVCVALSIGAGSGCEVAYFETSGFQSAGGSQLAHLLAAELPSNPKWPLTTVVGKRLPILRETRPPTVAVRLGPADVVAEQRYLVAASIAGAVTRWSTTPC